MDEKLDRVFDRLMALTPAQLAARLAAYKNNAFARALEFLHSADVAESVISKNEIEINRSDAQPQVKDEDLYDWVYAANDERFALAA